MLIQKLFPSVEWRWGGGEWKRRTDVDVVLISRLW